MIYKGKEYAEVTDNSGAIGDLVHVTEVERVGCDIWGFTTDSDFMTPDINVVLPNGWETLDGYNDEWTRYRYVKDAEENETGREKICKAGGECACVRQLRGVAKRGSQA